MQDRDQIYNYRDLYLIVPVNARITLGLKALDYTSYIGGIIVYDKDLSQSAPTSEWLEPNFMSVSWGGLQYVRVTARTVDNNSYTHGYQLSETPIYSNTSTKIKTYSGLFRDNYLLDSPTPSSVSETPGPSNNN